MRVDRAREAALDALAACRRNGAWIDGALKQVLKRDGLSGRDAAFASRIAYGVMQSRIYLDRCLARCLTQRPEKLEPLLLVAVGRGAERIELVPAHAGESLAYYRRDGVHCVPKLQLEELLLGNREAETDRAQDAKSPEVPVTHPVHHE